MSIDKIKKQARNLKRDLPAYIAEHPDGGTLTQVMDLVARSSGYPNLHAATEAAKAAPVKERPVSSWSAILTTDLHSWMRSRADDEGTVLAVEEAELNVKFLSTQDAQNEGKDLVLQKPRSNDNVFADLFEQLGFSQTHAEVFRRMVRLRKSRTEVLEAVGKMTQEEAFEFLVDLRASIPSAPRT